MGNDASRGKYAKMGSIVLEYDETSLQERSVPNSCAYKEGISETGNQPSSAFTKHGPEAGNGERNSDQKIHLDMNKLTRRNDAIKINPTSKITSSAS